MKSTKKSFRKTELFLFIVGLLLLLMSFLTSVLSQNKFSGCFEKPDSATTSYMSLRAVEDCMVKWQSSNYNIFILGYFFCFLAFTISYELFFLFEPNPKTRKWGYFLLTNLKLVIIGGLFYYVRLTGIPATSLAIGFIACQTLAVFVLLINAYRSNNLLKASRIKKTDSSD